MIKLVKELMKFLIVICFTIGGFLLFKKYYQQGDGAPQSQINLDSKTEALKNYLVAHHKPARIEIINLSKRYESEVNEIKKLKIPQDKNADFYLMIQFFTDESDEKAPLIAQIRFIEVKSGNTMKEESLNLE